jgi:hypothetical protein
MAGIDVLRLIAPWGSSRIAELAWPGIFSRADWPDECSLLDTLFRPRRCPIALFALRTRNLLNFVIQVRILILVESMSWTSFVK